MQTNINSIRRGLVFSALAALLPQAWGTSVLTMEVWKDPNCGCCQDWVDIIQKAGFKVIVHDTGNTAMRLKSGIPVELGSCHTARIGGYAIEGHVPVSEIQRLLSEKPDAIGLAVPGMPIGSPGMDGAAYGNRTQPYNVLLIKKMEAPRCIKNIFDEDYRPLDKPQSSLKVMSAFIASSVAITQSRKIS